MSGICEFYRTTVGKKVVMALSGIVLVGFVIAHMIGNLKIFAGVDPASGSYKFDSYAIFLREFGQDLFGHMTLLWIARVTLVIAVILHAWSGIQLARLNRLAKPQGTHKARYRSANAASRTMLYGGLLLVVFIIYHLGHFTFGFTHFNGFAHGKVYANVWNGFQNPLVTGFYVLSMAFLSLHLYHGTWSMFQTLGVDSPGWNGGLRNLSKAVAVLLFLGFSVVPLAVSCGFLKPPPAIVVQG